MYGRIGRQKMLAELLSQHNIYGKQVTMTDKQIIIDDVDVSGCEFFETKAQVMQCHMGALTQRCKANNCYYKQLLRKEQECEELKNELIDVKWNIEAQDIELNNNVEQLDQLKAENKHLNDLLNQALKELEQAALSKSYRYVVR